MQGFLQRKGPTSEQTLPFQCNVPSFRGIKKQTVTIKQGAISGVDQKDFHQREEATSRINGDNTTFILVRETRGWIVAPDLFQSAQSTLILSYDPIQVILNVFFKKAATMQRNTETLCEDYFNARNKTCLLLYNVTRPP